MENRQERQIQLHKKYLHINPNYYITKKDEARLIRMRKKYNKEM